MDGVSLLANSGQPHEAAVWNSFYDDCNMPSTVIAAIDYDRDRMALVVRFVSGTRYEYSPVPEAVYLEFKASKMKGIYYNQHIKGKFTHRKLA